MDCKILEKEIDVYLEQLITFWLHETPLYLFQLFYENEGTELEYAYLAPVEIIDLSGEMRIEQFLKLYDGREIPSCCVPGGWEYPTIEDNLRYVIDEIIQVIGIENIKRNLLLNQTDNRLVLQQEQFHSNLDDYDEESVAETIYTEIKDLLKETSENMYQSFFAKMSAVLLREMIIKNNCFVDFDVFTDLVIKNDR